MRITRRLMRSRRTSTPSTDRIPRARFLAGWMALFLLFCPATVRAVQEPVPLGRELVVVSAERVLYYSDAASVQARGNVHVQFPDGSSADGDAFSMDLSLRRFVVAGHVRLHTQAGEYVGAGIADFLEFRRVYFLPLEPDADRWTFLNGDYAHPKKGRAMPGDAFELPDLADSRPYIVAKVAVIDPTSFAKLSPAGIAVLEGPVRTPPLAPYVDNFSANSNFGVNSLSGATFDAPYNFAGSRASLDTLHFRYDQQRQVRGFLSFEHHSVFGTRGYAVFSLNPATQFEKQWNLLAYARTGANNALALETQLFTSQHGLTQPQSSSGFADLQFSQALRQSSLRLEASQEYRDLLGGSALANHPFAAGLQWSGFDQRLARTGLTYRLESGIATVHDVFGVSPTQLRDVASHFVGGAVYTPVYAGPLHTGLNALFRERRTYLSFPNVVDEQTFQASASRRLSRTFVAVGSYIVDSVRTDNPALTFATPNGSTGLVPAPTSPNGLPLVGGVGTTVAGATNRAIVLTAASAPSPTFQVTLTGIQNNYSPVQVPFVAGPPRYQAIGDVRMHLTRTLFLDLTRSYSFNWGNQRWSPQFGIVVTSQ